MHTLNVVVAKNTAQVYKECREALAREDFDSVRRIAKANPDLFVADGRVKL